MMMRGIFAFTALALVALSPGPVAAGPIDDLKQQCYVGTEPPTAAGSTPPRLNGVLTISPREAKCAIDRVPQVLVIAPMRDIKQLPGAVPFPLLARATLEGKDLATAQTAMAQLTGGDKNRPIILYCHHNSCGYSVEAARHLVQWGYGNVMWLRDGLSGWRAANFALTPLDKVKNAVGEASYTIWIEVVRDTAPGCLGAKKRDACDRTLAALIKIFVAPDLPPSERDIVAQQMYTVSAARIRVIRAEEPKGNPGMAYAESLDAYDSLKSYAASTGRPGTLARHAELVRELVIDALETDRPDTARAVLAETRADAAAGFATLAAVRSDEAARKPVFEMMIAMEDLESVVTEAAFAKAVNAGFVSQAAATPFRNIALDAVDRAVIWTERNASVGISPPVSLYAGDREREVRLTKLLSRRGDVLSNSGNEADAIKAYGLATWMCRSSENASQLATCENVTRAYFQQVPASQRWSKAQGEREYQLYLSQFKQ